MSEDVKLTHEGRRVPFRKGGWGVAAFIVFLAVASASAAAYIHFSTYRHPTDVRFHAVGARE